MEKHRHAFDMPPVSDDYQAYADTARTAPRTRLADPVREFMTSGVITIAEDATLRETCRAMARHRVNSLLVLGAESGHVLGWITAQGLLAWLERDPDVFRAGDAVSEPAVALHPNATADEALAALRRPGVSQVMVTRGDDRLPEGVVTPADLIALAGS